jgi:cob(I)alamin adenosyltransferase
MPSNQAESFSWYSGSGDNGTTGLLGGERVPKYHPQPDAYGTVDEASAALGLARALVRSGRRIVDVLLAVQRDLYRMMAELAATPAAAARLRAIDARRIEWLEETIDGIGGQLTVPREFVVPGDTAAGAALDLARTIVRRAERLAVRLCGDGRCDNHEIPRYLNRLSSLCFVLARIEDAAGGSRPTLAKKGE